MEKKERLLTIGQFAAMHGINKKTLMWYDEIGLFKPAVIDPENGYRCYTYHQSPILETILLLRELDVSLNEIQGFMKDRSAASMRSLLGERIAGLDAKIAHLHSVRKTLCSYHQNMTTLLTMDLSQISIIQKKESCLVTVDIDQDTTFEEEVEMITAETERYQLGRLHNAAYGSMIPVESLKKGAFDEHCKLFIEIPFLTSASAPKKQKAGLHIQPGGRYLKAFHKGDWDKTPQRYQEILAYAREHGLELTGYSYEMGINEMVIDRIEDYIMQIEIGILG